MNDDAHGSSSTGSSVTPTQLGDYEVVGALSEGGHGRFFVAVPPARLGLDTQVVIKVVSGGGDAAFRRFTRELRLFSRVSSPHLVKLYDAGQHEDVFFYSMEWCRGGTLAEPTHALSRGEKLRAIAGIARALHALHEGGIAHRDLRPGNVLLRLDGTSCLGDLSLAQVGGGSVTSMAPVTSIGFVDPALILGDTASRATDIYSLGALLHWTLTGATLHPGVDESDPMLAVRAVLRNPIHLHRQQLSEAEVQIIETCTASEAAARPATAAQVADAVDALIATEEPLT